MDVIPTGAKRSGGISQPYVAGYLLTAHSKLGHSASVVLAAIRTQVFDASAPAT